MNEYGTNTLLEKQELDMLLNAGLVLDHRDERITLLHRKRNVLTEITQQPHPGLDCLVLRAVDTRIWQSRMVSRAMDVRKLKRLTLIHCNNPMLMSWTQYPKDLESLEILSPIQTYPYKAGLVLVDNLLAKPLSHFRHLTQLNLQHIGAPICEVLFTLSVEAGKQLKVLKLADQDVTGIDKIYSFQRRGVGPLECPLYKLLVHLCPNLEVLCLDISNNAVENKPADVLSRAPDARFMAIEHYLEELQEAPSLPVFETLRSHQQLRVLQLITSITGDTRNETDIDMIASRSCSPDLAYFTFAFSAPPPSSSIDAVRTVED
ncbi:MAG: hypothetical protein Q9204_005263, partial [Flavoplaca sp. TL-2023a]